VEFQVQSLIHHRDTETQRKAKSKPENTEETEIREVHLGVAAISGKGVEPQVQSNSPQRHRDTEKVKVKTGRYRGGEYLAVVAIS
jgi:hypothetical protein